ncbi:hypothetical protein A4X09_0g7378 [Tilletia walkeri]|uniref:Uncharacterized protein n=1 Tax=Tilletia walkeri TaxID=117179 RepID=A0A8X7T1E3_9BASI|nr:hypothetical protein A4X09_0g7378 [Tilletia walkeri]
MPHSNSEQSNQRAKTSSVLSAAAQAPLPVTHLRQTSSASAPPLVHPASPEARRRANKRKGKGQSKGLVKPKAKRQKLEVRNIGKVPAEGNVPAHLNKALIVLNDIIAISPTIPAAIADEALLLLRPLQAGSRDSPPDLASQSAPADLESTIERLERGYTEIKSAQVRPMIDLLHIFSLQRQSKVDTAHGGQPNAARDFEHSKLEVRFRNGGMFSQHVPALSSQTVALPGHFDGRHGHSKMAVFLKHAPMVSTGPRALRAMMRTKTAAMALG